MRLIPAPRVEVRGGRAGEGAELIYICSVGPFLYAPLITYVQSITYAYVIRYAESITHAQLITYAQALTAPAPVCRGIVVCQPPWSVAPVCRPLR